MKENVTTGNKPGRLEPLPLPLPLVVKAIQLISSLMHIHITRTRASNFSICWDESIPVGNSTVSLRSEDWRN